MTVKGLVDALAAGDSSEIEANFNQAMSEKISAALDSYRVDVAQRMFNVPEEVTTEE
jgi:uncharacterized protein (DUF433 family)